MKISDFIKTVITLSCFSVLTTLMACNESSTDRFVACMDSLYQVNPNATIDSIDRFMESGISLSRRNNMVLNLYRFRAMNSVGVTFTSDSVARLIVDYFNGHGTLNERMSAYYVLGSVYRDMDNYPEALVMYQKALTLANGTDEKVDYKLLYKIYGQNGDVLFRQMAFNDAVGSYRSAAHVARDNSDVLYELIAQEQICKILKLQNKQKQSYILRKRISEKYWRLGYKDLSIRCLLPNIRDMLSLGKIGEAYKILMLYRYVTGDVDSLGVARKGCERYYTLMADYNVAVLNYNDAVIYYNKAIHSTTDFSEHEQCFKGLALLYRKMNNVDSVAKYSELARVANDSLYSKMSTARMQQLQAAFNYKMKEQSEARITLKMKNYRMLLLVISLVFVVFILIFCFLLYRNKMQMKLFWSERQRKMEEMALDNEKMSNEVVALEKAKAELALLSDSQQQEILNLINEKEILVHNTYDKLQRSENDFADDSSCYSIFERFQHLANVEYKKPLVNDWYEMDRYILQHHPSVFKLRKSITNVEYNVTILVRLGFKSSEICVLLGLSKSNVSNIRKRLYKKLTGKDGSSKDFDCYVKCLV